MAAARHHKHNSNYLLYRYAKMQNYQFPLTNLSSLRSTKEEGFKRMGLIAEVPVFILNILLAIYH